MADIALSAFAVFFILCPSFLSFQGNIEKGHGRNNADRNSVDMALLPA
jgi:hypothetical protein